MNMAHPRCPIDPGDGWTKPGDAWKLFAIDLFDRESEPHLDEEGVGLKAGLKALWKRMLNEAVQDDGQATFTDFALRVESRGGSHSFSIRRESGLNAPLGKLRAWRNEPNLLDALAAVHARIILDSKRWDGGSVMQHAESEPILQLAASLESVGALLKELRP
jgi:hypothetical protein